MPAAALGSVGRRGLRVAGFCGATVDQELADQVLELHRRLRQHEFVAVLEHVRRAAGLHANVLVAQ